MTVQIKGVHPYAEQFPLMNEPDLQELADSIKASGLRMPITITPDGLILDGRNRFEACKKAKVTPKTVIYEGEDLATFVIDANASRRHMSTGAKAMATALVLKAAGQRKFDPESGEPGKWEYGSTKRGSSSTSEVKALTQAGVIIDYRPDLATEVVKGVETLNSAYEKALKDKKAKEERAEMHETLVKAKATKFLDLVKDEILSVESAFAAYERENKEELDRQAAEIKAGVDLYSGIARAIRTLSHYGDWDGKKIMEKYTKEIQERLDSLGLDENFDIPNLVDLQQFTEKMIQWSKNARK